MSIWAWLKDLFVTSAPSVGTPPQEKPMPMVEPSPQKTKKTAKDYKMAGEKLWLVVIDNSDIPEANALRPPGLHNFYIVNAPDEISAKGFVWRSFGNNRALIAQIALCTFATPLELIVSTVNDRPGKFWSYIPIGGRRSYGQRRVTPKQEGVLAKNEYGELSAQAYQHVPPDVPIGTTPLTEQELREARAEIGGARPSTPSPVPQQAPQMPQMPNIQGMDPQAMMAAMAAMMQAFAQNQQPVAPAPAPLSEAELEKQAELLQGSVPIDQLPPEVDRAARLAAVGPSAPLKISEEEDADLKAAIEAQRAAGKIPKAGDLPDDFKIENDVDDIEGLSRKLKSELDEMNGEA